MPFFLYLSKEGAAVEIKGLNEIRTSIPEQAEASASKTHREVLVFLKKIKDSELRTCLVFYHHHNEFYHGHPDSYQGGTVHLCSLERLISFVKYKLGESEHGIRYVPPPKRACILQ
jgi:hypothetical protein